MPLLSLGARCKNGGRRRGRTLFVVREPHCHGFDQGTERTPQSWFENQQLTDYNAANDRYMRLMALVRGTGKPLEARLATMSVLCLYQLDKFRELIGRHAHF